MAYHTTVTMVATNYTHHHIVNNTSFVIVGYTFVTNMHHTTQVLLVLAGSLHLLQLLLFHSLLQPLILTTKQH